MNRQNARPRVISSSWRDALRRTLHELRLPRVGQIGRNIQQRLALVVEVRLHHQLAGVFDPNAVADVLEASGHRQRRRGEHRRLQMLEQCRAQDVRDRNRRGLQKDVVLGARVRCGVRSRKRCCAAFDSRMNPKLHAHLFHAAGQRVNLVGLVGDGLQLGVEVQQRILQTEILVAILFQKLRAVLEGEAALARRNQREEELRAVAHMTASRHESVMGTSTRRNVCSTSRSSSSTRRFETVTPK